MEKTKMNLYDWRELTDQIIINEDQIKLLNFLHKNDYLKDDIRFEIVGDEIKCTDLT